MVGDHPHEFQNHFKTIEALRSLFERYGIPEELLSDDGPQLAAEEFTKLMR